MLVAMTGMGSLRATSGAPAPRRPEGLKDEGDETAPATTAAPGAAGGTPAWPRFAWWAMVAAVALPFVASAISVFLGVGGDYHPGGDVALTEMQVRDIGRYEVLLGPFSRDGWHHPGPALYYVLAAPYRLLGSSADSLAAGALLVNGLSIVGIVALGRRRGGTPLMLCLLITCGLMVRAMGFEFLAMAWNPWVTVLPYGLLVMLTWAMTCGDRWALPVAALVATFVVQTHVGYAALALPLVAFGAVWLVIGAVREGARARREPRSAGEVGAPPGDTGPSSGTGGNGTAEVEEAEAAGSGSGDGTEEADAGAGVSAGAGADGREPRARRGNGRRLAGAVLVTAALAALAWLPPLVQQLNHEPGNLGVIVRWFGERGDEARTFGEGWNVVSSQYGLWPEWLVGQADSTLAAEPVYVLNPLAPVLLAVVVVAAVAAWRRPGGDARRFVAVWLVASVLGIVAVARTVGLLYAYRLAWTWPLGAIAGAYCLWVGWTWLAARVPGAERRALVPVAVAALVVITGVDVVAAARAGSPEPERSHVIGELGEEVAEALPADAGSVRVVPTSFLGIAYSSGLQVELERRGFDARYTMADPWVVDHREPPRRPWGVLVVVTDGDVPASLDDPELELLGYSSDLTIEELRARVAELEDPRAELEAEVAEGESAEATVERMAASELPPGTAAAVFRGPRELTPVAHDPAAGPGTS